MIVQSIAFDWDGVNFTEEQKKEFHTEYGRLSNIPECCIGFWNDVLTPYRRKQIYDEKQLKEKYGEDFNLEEYISMAHFNDRKYQYRRCPDCAKYDRANKIVYNWQIPDKVIEMANRLGMPYYFVEEEINKN